MIIKYVNSTGQEVNLNEMPYKMLVSDILDYEWEAITASNKITGFGYKVREKKLNIDVHRGKEKGARENMNALTDIFEKDVSLGTPGKLYIDDQYMVCYIKSSEKDNWETDQIIQCEYGIITDYPLWIKEHHIQLLSSSRKTSEQQGLSFPFDFSFDFAQKKSGSETAWIDHYKASNFRMIMYGPCIDPTLKINDYPYKVHTNLKEEEYLEIDSRANTIMKYTADGSSESLYNSREFEHSIFEKIPSGGLHLIWEGDFGIDITLYLERSEPKW